jgi:hypothetical protein
MSIPSGGGMTSDDGRGAVRPRAATGPALRKLWATPRVITPTAARNAAGGTSVTTPFIDVKLTGTTSLAS